MPSKLANSLLFLWASLISALISTLAFISILANEKSGTGKSKRKKTTAFLADEQRALTFYNVFSALYDRVNPYLYTSQMRNQILELMNNNHRISILDAGCGTGYTTKGILERTDAEIVIGIDMNRKQLKKARAKLRAERKKLSLFRADVENLPFNDGVFDAVVSVGAVEYFPNPEAAFREMRRVVRSEGKIVIGGPVLDWFRRIYLDHVFYTPSKDELQTLFKQVGLRKVKSLLTGVDTFLGTKEYVVAIAGTK